MRRIEASIVHALADEASRRGQVIGVRVSDVAEEDASAVVHDLRGLGIPQVGSIDIERLDASVSRGAVLAERRAHGLPGDAVIWEQVARSMTEQGYLSWGLVLLFALSGVIASVAILIDSAPIVVGAMALSPDFAPLAVFAIGAVRLRPDVALQGFAALGIGFTVGILAGFLGVWLLVLTGVAPEEFQREGNILATSIAAPDWYSVIVAVCAGSAGMLSVTLSRSSASPSRSRRSPQRPTSDSRSPTRTGRRSGDRASSCS